jgi:hypothetical protein
VDFLRADGREALLGGRVLRPAAPQLLLEPRGGALLLDED